MALGGAVRNFLWKTRALAYPPPMVRLIAFFIVLAGLGFAYEEYTGNSVGVKRTIRTVAGFAGFEYGYAAGAATPAFGGLGGLAGSAGRMMGN